MQARVTGTVRGISRYIDGTVSTEVQLRNQDIDPTTFPPDMRNEIKLVIGNSSYSAGLRRTAKNPPYICPNLFDLDGNKVRLSEVLTEHNIQINEKINVLIDNHLITLQKQTTSRC